MTVSVIKKVLGLCERFMKERWRAELWCAVHALPPPAGPRPEQHVPGQGLSELG